MGPPFLMPKPVWNEKVFLRGTFACWRRNDFDGFYQKIFLRYKNIDSAFLTKNYAKLCDFF